MNDETTGAAETTESEASDATRYDMPMPKHLLKAISADWDPAPSMPHPARPDGAPTAAAHRAALSSAFPGQALVIPAGRLAPRANDTDYAFRASSSFTWASGETTADAVLLLLPTRAGHEATLFIGEYAQPGEPGYFTSRGHGALWVGNVPSIADTEAVLTLRTRPLTELDGALDALRGTPTAVLTGVDATIDSRVADASDGVLAQTMDELRLVKDSWELGRLGYACEVTARGFADVVRELPRVIDRRDLRGERWLEGTFWRRARLEGNEVGYTSIVGAGQHATTLHWWRNHGVVESGQLLLADMGVETDELYTADVTRTMPINGSWSPDQLRVYRAVLEAQEAGIAEVKEGADFLAAHRAAMWVLADHLHSWGILPVTADVSCDPDEERPGAGLHRRYTLHGTSHMLGIDVHDCAKAREETYRNGTFAAGMVLTVEPGLYFQSNDRTVPAELRGMGVRIEDDIAVTTGNPMNLSAGLPRDPSEIEAWMREVQSTPAVP
jgi:Xaa-Pro aminopeptidase